MVAPTAGMGNAELLLPCWQAYGCLVTLPHLSHSTSSMLSLAHFIKLDYSLGPEATELNILLKAAGVHLCHISLQTVVFKTTDVIQIDYPS